MTKQLEDMTPTAFTTFVQANIEGATILAEIEPDGQDMLIHTLWVVSLDDPYTAVPYFTDKTVDQFVNPGGGLDDELDDLEETIYGMAMARMERAVLSAIESDEGLVEGELYQAYIEEQI